MEERKEVLIVCLILLAVAIVGFCLTIFYSSFNFNKAELSINENNISEKLFFAANKDYHTLFRIFKSPIKVAGSESYPISQDGYIQINAVSCSKGTSYAKEMSGATYTFPEKTQTRLAYTKPNEYGCTFGNVYGFSKGKDYWIKSDFTLMPKTLFKIQGKYYIKFVAYSKNNHKLLIKNDNLLINGEAIAKSYYLPISDVIIYVPYNPQNLNNFNIIEKDDFYFEGSGSSVFMLILIFISPTLIFFLVWYFLGKENIGAELPPEMSFYPRERKGWEVAAFFHPPFSAVNQNFFSAIMLDLYRRKIIDTKMKGNEVYIKINDTQNKTLDKIERGFLHILEKVYKKCNEKYKDGEYFNLKKAAGSFWLRSEVISSFNVLRKEVKEEGKSYLDKNAMAIAFLLFSGLLFLQFLLLRAVYPIIFVFFFVSFGIVLTVSFTNSILIKFKGEYYKEYEHWQAFRKFLKYSNLKEHSHKGVILWEQYLVYAAALGVAKRVLKELKNEGLINEKQYNAYRGFNATSVSFAASSGAAGGGAGGGVGGGGVGGGGGGGR